MKNMPSKLGTHNFQNKRWDSFESSNSVGATRKQHRAAIRQNMNDVIKIKDMDEDINSYKEEFEGHPHSHNSSRNQNNRLGKYLHAKDMIKNTMNYDRSELKLDNSSDMQTYMTLVPNKKSNLSKTEEIDFKNDMEVSSIKRPKKLSNKSKKIFNDRLQSTLSIYKKSSLNIANFLNNYTTQVNNARFSRKQRKSGRSSTLSNYKSSVTKKINERSRSNKSHYNDYSSQVNQFLF